MEQVCRPELLKTVGISHELCLEKARVAMLLNVAKRFSHKPIPYQEFANALEISYEEVSTNQRRRLRVNLRWNNGSLKLSVKAYSQPESIKFANLFLSPLVQIEDSKVIAFLLFLVHASSDDDWQRLKIQLNEWKDMLVSMEQTMADTMVSESSQHSALRIQ